MFKKVLLFLSVIVFSFIGVSCDYYPVTVPNSDTMIKIDDCKYLVPAKIILEFIKDKEVIAITGTGSGGYGMDDAYIVILAHPLKFIK